MGEVQAEAHEDVLTEMIELLVYGVLEVASRLLHAEHPFRSRPGHSIHSNHLGGQCDRSEERRVGKEC